MVIILNFLMVLLLSLFGFILFSVIIITIIGFNAGALIAQADKKTIIFSIIVLIFELGAFSTSAGIGFYIGIEWIYNGKLFFQIFSRIFNEGWFLIPLLSLFLNGVFEASGIFFNIEGVPGIKAYKERLYK
ncbi:MAG: hypothetical protein OQK82_01385 [Candidatus Pacearchaeota archaeon]|nr:hypothetical protein [Candidatus Pacearchaeota archaeon]